jgi:hypothetical protein
MPSKEKVKIATPHLDALMLNARPRKIGASRGRLGQKEMTVGATMDDPQELLNTARRHCQAIQTIIDKLTETKSNTELRLLSQSLQRLAFHAAPRGRDG